MTPQELMAAATEVLDRFPDARLLKNPVGNLAIVAATAEPDEYVGYIDLHTGEVRILDYRASE